VLNGPRGEPFVQLGATKVPNPVGGQVIEFGAPERRYHAASGEAGVSFVGAALHRVLHRLQEPAVEVFAHAGATSVEWEPGALLGPRLVALLDRRLLRLAIILAVLDGALGGHGYWVAQ
jgi:hypothetical protein